MQRSFVSSLLAPSLLALGLLTAGCAAEQSPYTAEQVRSAIAEEGITVFDTSADRRTEERAPAAARPLPEVLNALRGAAGIRAASAPGRTILQGFGATVVVYARAADAEARYRDLQDRLAAAQILDRYATFGVKRRGNVGVGYPLAAPADARLGQIDPSMLDGSFERRVAAALERL